MFEIKEYSVDMRCKVLEFLSRAFGESGKLFEPEGRHKVFACIEQNFIGFWCMVGNDDIIGTVAVKKLGNTDCELKGLYVFEEFHGMGLGHRLAETAVDFAKHSGYERIFLDTVSTYRKALRLYEKMGFRRTERYNDNDKADIFMMKELNVKAEVR